VNRLQILMTICRVADVRARFHGAGCAGPGWRMDFLRIGARVRAPALSRRLSSFLFAGWLPHAKYASWGCLGLTRGDRRCRSQFSEEDSHNRPDALIIASFARVFSAGRPGAFAGEAKHSPSPG
jgi:hypothetical protein